MIKVVSVQITNRCNGRCKHCFVNGGQEIEQEMSTAELKKFIYDYAKETDAKGRINVFGGEPLLRSDIYELIEAAHDAGVEIELATAGNVEEKRIEELIESRPDFMSFDLDGGRKESHDWLRNQEGHFDKMINVIKKFVAAQIYTNVIMVVHKNNIDEIEEFLDICKTCNVQEATIQFFTPIGRGKKISELVVSSEEWLDIDARITKWKDRKKPEFTIAWQCAYVENNSSEACWDCKTNDVQRIFLKANGDIMRCALLHNTGQVVGNVKNEELSQILSRLNETKYSCAKYKGCPSLAYQFFEEFRLEDPRGVADEYKPACPRERKYYE